VVLGLLCNAEGCPVGVEVFAGNTQDASTVVTKIQELRRDYGLKQITFVGDRGMVTQANAEELKQVEGLHTISALTHRQIVELVERKVIQAELFDEQRIAEVIDPKKPKRRYCLCRNPQSGARETATRQRLLDRTREALDKIVGRKKKGSTEKLSAQVGKILARYKMGKFVEWQIEAGRLKWHFKEALIKQEKLFDGCYIVSATVPKEQMNQDEVVGTYKNLSVVEQAFRNLKTVSLEIRPVYHKKDDRINGGFYRAFGQPQPGRDLLIGGHHLFAQQEDLEFGKQNCITEVNKFLFQPCEHVIQERRGPAALVKLLGTHLIGWLMPVAFLRRLVVQ
jgi:transposase